MYEATHYFTPGEHTCWENYHNFDSSKVPPGPLVNITHSREETHIQQFNRSYTELLLNITNCISHEFVHIMRCTYKTTRVSSANKPQRNAHCNRNGWHMLALMEPISVAV